MTKIKWWDRGRARIWGLTWILAGSVLCPRIGRYSLPQTLAPSVPPLALGRGAGESMEELTWPSSTSPALPCYACPLVEMELPWGGCKEQTWEWDSHLTGVSAGWWHQLVTYTQRVDKHQGVLPGAWESQPTLGWRLSPKLAQLPLSPPPVLDSSPVLLCLSSSWEPYKSLES